jgi:hypothetical protein
MTPVVSRMSKTYIGVFGTRASLGVWEQSATLGSPPTDCAHTAVPTVGQ